jgi:hypothetical protein
MVSSSSPSTVLGRVFGSIAVAIATAPLFGLALGAQAPASVPVVPDGALQAITTTIGGARVLPTTRTVAHWWGSTVNESDGVTYGYNMAGADPHACVGAACTVTIDVDITPINISVGGMWFKGTDVVAATLASPQFTVNDYGVTPAATAAGAFPSSPQMIRGSGGALSQGDAGQALQLQDATMRAQFNLTGAGSPYHLQLNPIVHPAQTIVVPSNHGTLLQSGRAVIFASVNIQWWAAQLQNLNSSLRYTDPTHLPLYLTDNVLLYSGTNPLNTGVIGFHGAGTVPGGTGSVHGNGNQPVQTYAWASYLSPGVYARPNGGSFWALQDIHALSHEIAEWADDPFVNNAVQPWLTPTAPQYGCTDVLETGDPVVGIGFATGTNMFRQGPNPNGTQSADGFYHPEDEVFLPWFMRTAPNTISEPTQLPTPNIGRYSLMGSLNPFPGFRMPATGC